MRTRFRMPEEGADFVRRFCRQDVLELARLLLDFGLAIHRERVREEPLREPMPANDVRGALTSADGELNNQRAFANRDARRLERVVAGIHEWPVIMQLRRMGMSCNQA